MLESDPVVRLQTNLQILRNFGKRWAQATDLQAPILTEIARAAELLLQLRLYELFLTSPFDLNSLCACIILRA